MVAKITFLEQDAAAKASVNLPFGKLWSSTKGKKAGFERVFYRIYVDLSSEAAGVNRGITVEVEKALKEKIILALTKDNVQVINVYVNPYRDKLFGWIYVAKLEEFKKVIAMFHIGGYFFMVKALCGTNDPTIFRVMVYGLPLNTREGRLRNFLSDGKIDPLLVGVICKKTSNMATRRAVLLVQGEAMAKVLVEKWSSSKEHTIQRSMLKFSIVV